jgi:lipopolysaccharide biosynthesis regulator YciM
VVKLARQLNDLNLLAASLVLGSTIYGFTGDVKTALAWGEEAIGLARKNDMVYEQAVYAGTRMFLAVLSNERVAPEFVAESIRITRASGNPWVLAMAYMNIGRLQVYQGEFEEAHKFLAEAEALIIKMRDRGFTTSCRSEIGHAYRKQGLFSKAMEMYRETILAFQEMGQRAAVAHELECIAFIARAKGECEHAVQLLGAVESLRERLNTDMTLVERRDYEEELSALRNQVDQTVLAKTWAQGRDMTMEEAITLALEA